MHFVLFMVLYPFFVGFAVRVWSVDIVDDAYVSGMTLLAVLAVSVIVWPILQVLRVTFSICDQGGKITLNWDAIFAFLSLLHTVLFGVLFIHRIEQIPTHATLIFGFLALGGGFAVELSHFVYILVVSSRRASFDPISSLAPTPTPPSREPLLAAGPHRNVALPPGHPHLSRH